MTLIWAVILLISIMAIFLSCVMPTKSMGAIEVGKLRLAKKEKYENRKMKVLKLIKGKLDGIR